MLLIFSKGQNVAQGFALLPCSNVWGFNNTPVISVRSLHVLVTCGLVSFLRVLFFPPQFQDMKALRLKTPNCIQMKMLLPCNGI